jgi:hypothetical protein
MEPMKAVFARGSSTIRLEGPPDEIGACLQNPAVSKQLVEALSSCEVVGSNIDNKTLELAINHAWSWFELHADHRMRALNFFVVSIAFLTAAYVTAVQFAHPLVSIIVCLAGLAFTLCFSRADVRIGELIKASEAVLRPLQGQLAQKTSLDMFRISELVEKSKHCFCHYSAVIRTIHITAALMLLLGAGYAAAIHLGYLGPVK